MPWFPCSPHALGACCMHHASTVESTGGGGVCSGGESLANHSPGVLGQWTVGMPAQSLGPFWLLSQNTETEWLINSRHLFLTVLESACPKSRRCLIWSLVRACFLVYSWSSLHCDLTQPKGQESFVGSLHKYINPIHKGFAHMT